MLSIDDYALCDKSVGIRVHVILFVCACVQTHGLKYALAHTQTAVITRAVLAA